MEKSFNTGTSGYKNLVTGGFPVLSMITFLYSDNNFHLLPKCHL